MRKSVLFAVNVTTMFLLGTSNASAGNGPVFDYCDCVADCIGDVTRVEFRASVHNPPHCMDVGPIEVTIDPPEIDPLRLEPLESAVCTDRPANFSTTYDGLPSGDYSFACEGEWWDGTNAGSISSGPRDCSIPVCTEDPCAGVDCSAYDDDCNVGQCNPDTGECFADPRPAGTACGNTTDYVCNNPDVCNGSGSCVDNLEPDGTECPDIVDDCFNAACMNGTCDQAYEPSLPGTPCGNRTDYVCNNPDVCDGFGVCDDNLEPNGTPCPDIAVECSDAACMNGACDQSYAPSPAGTACGDPSDTDCDNPDSCDGAGTCASNYELVGTPCDDGLFCSSNDACDEIGICQPGTPLDCDDGVGCTDDSCDEAADVCVNAPNDANCPDDGLFCNGTEFCDPVLDCASTGDPCSGNECNTCQEDIDQCFDPAGTACGDPTDTDCDNPDSCDGAGTCASNYEPAGTDCSDGVFCNGAETCEGNSGDCLAGIDPCLVSETCDEDADLCAAACEDPSPLTQGYWHRQCLGLPADEGGLDPGRNGRGPKKNQESDFPYLMECAGDWLEYLEIPEPTCLALDADPPSDPCERAIRQLTALLLNICSDNLSLGCELDLSCASCSAISVGGLIDEVSTLINSRDPHECKLASECAALVNEGEGLAVPGVQLNEIRIDQPGTDDDEYFELQGPEGTTLNGLTYLTIGDLGATDCCGIVETVVYLTGQSIPPGGFFVGAESTFSLGAADLTTTLDFENSDNVTHMLVRDFSGVYGEDLDTDNDGVLDSPPWSDIVDCVALIETPGSGDKVYCSTTVGPAGSFVPGHVYRCPSGWIIGLFDPVGGEDTPGAANVCDASEGCCYPDGSCADTTPAYCSATGGTSQGTGTGCADAMCSQPVLEACCYVDETCDNVTYLDCLAQGGFRQGAGTDCSQLSCSPP